MTRLKNLIVIALLCLFVAMAGTDAQAQTSDKIPDAINTTETNWTLSPIMMERRLREVGVSAKATASEVLTNVPFGVAVVQALASGTVTYVSQTPMDNTTFAPGQTFTAKWTFKNGTSSGMSIDRAVNTSIVYRFADVNSQTVGLTVAKGGSFTVSIPMRAPDIPGTYNESWRLHGVNNTIVFPKFTLSIKVQANSTPAPIPTTAYVDGRFLFPLRPPSGAPAGWDRRFSPVTSSRFGDWVVDTALKGHLGEDYPIAYGTPVYSMGRGTVVFSRNAGTGWGNVVIIAHRDPRFPNESRAIYSLYGHLSRLDVAPGRIVDWNTQIGLSGREGTGNHLHLELRSGVGGAASGNGTGAAYDPGPGYSKDVTDVFNASSKTLTRSGFQITWIQPSSFIRQYLVAPK